LASITTHHAHESGGAGVKRSTNGLEKKELEKKKHWTGQQHAATARNALEVCELCYLGPRVKLVGAKQAAVLGKLAPAAHAQGRTRLKTRVVGRTLIRDPPMPVRHGCSYTRRTHPQQNKISKSIARIHRLRKCVILNVKSPAFWSSSSQCGRGTSTRRRASRMLRFT